MDNDVVYDGFSFIANGLVLTNINHLTLPTRSNQIAARANRAGGVLVQSNLGIKPIYLEGYYIGSSPVDTQQMYDVLAAVLNRQERPLVLPHAGLKRQYIATPQNAIIQEPDGLNKLTFSFEFVVPKGSSEDVLETTLIDTNTTQQSTTIPLNVTGSVEARPLIVLTYGTITGGTGKTVSIRNAKDYIGLTIERDWATDDTIIIDSSNFQIYINDVLTAPTGRLPKWPPGTGALYYTDTLTTRSVDILATYKAGNL